MIVTVDKRPAVHETATLNVTLTNKEEKLSKPLTIGAHTFPMTFSLTGPGRSGDVTISIDGLDDMGQVVGRGETTAKLDDMAASVTLDSADFVVNSDYAQDQYLTTDFEAVGFQLAASGDLSTWTSTYMQQCGDMCNVFARRFDTTGLPVTSSAAASDHAFPVTTSPTKDVAMPAVAATKMGTLAFWDFTDPTGSPTGVACRAIDMNGATPMSAQGTIATESADVVSATGLSNDNFAVTWQAPLTKYVIHSAIVKPDCTLLGPVFTANSNTTVDARRAHVAANGTTIMYSWIADSPTSDPTMGGVRIRVADLGGGFAAAEKPLVANTTSQLIEHARISAWGTGFAVAVRWATPYSTEMPDGPGKIEVYRVSAAGDLVQGPILISDDTHSNFESKKGFSIAQRPDGALMVVWHICPSGAGLCDVYGRILRPTGAQVGPPFLIPTSSASDQINPSVIALQDSFVAAWNDSSGELPDMSGTAVRARILYPIYDDAKGVHGATCGASAPGAPACDDGLACAMGSDGVQRCYAKCTPPSCPGGGTCSTVDETTSACTF
jgi:hypothetical protein